MGRIRTRLLTTIPTVDFPTPRRLLKRLQLVPHFLLWLQGQVAAVVSVLNRIDRLDGFGH